MSAPKPVSPVKSPSKLRGIIALLIVAVIGIAAICFIFSGDSTPKPKARPAKAEKSEKPAKKYKSIDEISPIKTNRQHYASSPKSVAEAMSRMSEAQEPLKLTPVKPQKISPQIKRTFKTGTEQLLSWICHVEPGDMPMPIPSLSEDDRENMLDILNSKNVVEKDDSPEAANAKMMVEEAKKEMLKFVQQGGDPDEFMQYYFRELRKAFEKRNYAISMIDEMKEENPELAKEFRKQVNKNLADEGIKAIEDFEDEDE